MGRFFSDEAADPSASLKDSMQVAADKSPDEFSKTLGLAQNFGVQPEIVEQNKPDFVRASEADHGYLEQYHAKNPKTSQWFSDYENASIAKDDMQNLSDTEQAAQDHSLTSDIFHLLISGGAETLSGSIKSLAALPTLASKMPLVGQEDNPDSLDFGMAEKFKVFRDNPVTRFLDKTAEENTPAQAKLSFSTELADGNVKLAGQALAYQVAKSLPVLGLMAIQPEAGLAALFASSTGAKYDANLKNNIPEDQAATNAVITGAINTEIQSLSGIGAAPLKALFKRISAVAGEETAKQLVKTSIIDVLTLGGKQGAEGSAASIASDLNDYFSGVNPKALDGIWQRAVDQFAVQGATGAGLGSVAHAPDMVEVANKSIKRATEFAQAKGATDFLTTLKESADNSKLLKRMGDKYREVINKQVENTPVQTAYVDVNKVDELFERKGLDPVQEMSKLGLLERYNEAKKNNGDIAVDTGTVAQKLTQEDYYEDLKKEMRFDPEHKSQVEVEEDQKAQKAQDDANREMMAEQAFQKDEEIKRAFNEETAARAKESRKKIREDVTQQLVDAGYSPKEATVNATIHEAVFGALEDRYGIDAGELFKAYGPKIVKANFSEPEPQTPKIMSDEKGASNSVIDTIKKIVGMKLPDPELVKKAKEDMARQKFDALSKRLQDELAAGPDIKRDRKKNIKPQLSVLYAMSNDILLGSGESAQLKMDENGVVIGRHGHSSVAPDYVKENKGSMTYAQARKRIADIIKKVEDNTPLNKNDNNFIEKFYEGSVDSVKNNLGRMENNKLIKEMLKQSGDDEPFTLFQQDSGKIQGSYTPAEQLIKIGEAKNLSTFVHESGHYFFDVLDKIVYSGHAPSELITDYNKIIEYVGAKEGMELTVDQHEKFADAFVNYLATGEAPSRGLMSAFNTFKNWLFAVYKGVRLNPKLNPEITGVFDRLLATDEEMKSFRDGLQEDFFSDGKNLGLKGPRLERYNEAMREANAQAEMQNFKNTVDHQNLKLSAEYKAKEGGVRNYIEAEANSMRVFKAIDDIKNNEHIDKLSREDVERYGKLAEQIPQELMKRGGSSVDVIAQVHGYADGHEMLKEIAANPDKEAWIKNQVDQSMAKEYPELLPLAGVSEAAAQAVNDASREKVYQLRHEIMHEQYSKVLDNVAKKIMKKMPSTAEMKLRANEILGEISPTEIKPGLYKRGQQKNAKLSADLYAKGDYAAAGDALINESLNYHLHRAATDIVAEMKSDKKYFSKIVNSKDADMARNHDMDFVNAARAVLELHGLGTAKKTLDDYMGAIQKYDKERYMVLSEMAKDVQADSGGLDEITYGQYTKMRDLVDAFMDLAKSLKEYEYDGKKLELDQVVSKVKNNLVDITSKKDKFKYTSEMIEKGFGDLAIKILDARASKKRVEHLAGYIGEDMLNYTFRKVKDGEVKFFNDRPEFHKKIVDILARDDWFKNKDIIDAPELGDKFNRSQLFHLLLHAEGNESNRRKLVLGREGYRLDENGNKVIDSNGSPTFEKWGSLNEDGTLNDEKLRAFIQRMKSEGIFTKAIYDKAADIGKVFNELNDVSQKAHKDIYGFYYGNVKTKTFTNEFGTYEGWYVPARVDPELARIDAQRRGLQKMVEGQSSYEYPSPSTGRGFTKDRNENYHGPLELNSERLLDHIDGVLKFSHIEPQIKDVLKLVKNEDMHQAFDAFDKKLVGEILMPWLDRSATQKILVPSSGEYGKGIDLAARYMRKNSAMQIFFLNIPNTFVHATQIFPAMVKIDPYHLAKAAVAHFSNTSKNVAELSELSPWFKSEVNSSADKVARDIKSILRKQGQFTEMKEYLDDHKYVTQSAMHNTVKAISMRAAINQMVAENPGMPMKDIIFKAENMTRVTHGGTKASDISASEVGSELNALFISYTGYFNNIANLRGSEWKSEIRKSGLKKSIPAMFGIYMLSTFIPALVTNQIMRVFAGRKLTEDDGSDSLGLLHNVFAPMVENELMMLPTNYLAQSAMRMAINHITKIPYGTTISAAGFTPIETGAKLGKDLYDNLADDVDNTKKVTNDAMSIIGLLTGAPTAAVMRPISYQMDVNSGKAEPTGPIDYTRGLITGKRGDKE